jgi:uncharacterized protein YciI
VTGLVATTVVLLRRPANPPDLPETRLDELQAEHLAFLGTQIEAGTMLAAGPFRDQEDAGLRGLCVYAVPVDEARAIAATDPLVVAGRLSAQAFSWLTPPGQAAFGPGA